MTQTQADAQPTCGKGLAASSVLPAKLGELLDAQAEVLERHIKAIDPSDLGADCETEAYTRLSTAYRGIASALRKQADDMAGCRDLPMPRHDVSVLTAVNGQMDAFRRFVSLERELQALLESKIESEQSMLA